MLITLKKTPYYQWSCCKSIGIYFFEILSIGFGYGKLREMAVKYLPWRKCDDNNINKFLDFIDNDYHYYDNESPYEEDEGDEEDEEYKQYYGINGLFSMRLISELTHITFSETNKNKKRRITNLILL